MRKKALVLLSGGLDSAVTLSCVPAGTEAVALTLNYGQRHVSEILAAKAIAAYYRVEHIVEDLGMQLARSALTADVAVPAAGSTPTGLLPSTYVPARNLVFLSYAVAMAVKQGCGSVWIGANAVDYSGYPDCRPRFLETFAQAVALGVEPHVDVRFPLVHWDKKKIIQHGSMYGVPFKLTQSCYDPVYDGVTDGYFACGKCDSCKIRRDGFEAANLPDPTRYV